MKDCLFCKIVSGEVPSHKIWEDDKHMAFLTIFPNTEGVSVVITKEHYPSYIFDLDDKVISDLMKAAKTVAKLMDQAYDDVSRTGLIFEGFGVDHIHAKLYPMHGTGNLEDWHPIESSKEEYFDTYPGYLSSHDSKRADDEHLKKVAEKIKSAKISDSTN